MNRLLEALTVIVVLTGCEKVDAETRVLARNVIVESSNRSALTSGDAQSAFETLTLNLGVVMVGTWDIVNKNMEPAHVPTGRVQISAGGAFTLLSGSFAAIGEGSADSCQHAAGSETYELLTPKLVAFRHTNPSPPTSELSALPMLVDLQQDSITFVGSGGCGQLGVQRVSILTRVPGTDAGP